MLEVIVLGFGIVPQIFSEEAPTEEVFAIRFANPENAKKFKEEFEAVQFTAQSTIGKKLLSKCRLLQKENEEFGNQEQQIHKLENELSLQRQLTEELKKSLFESNEFVVQFNEEVEAMHSEIFGLKEQLKAYEAQQQTTTKEN